MGKFKRIDLANKEREQSAKDFVRFQTNKRGGNVISTIKTIDMGKVLGVIPFVGGNIKRKAGGGLAAATAKLKAQGLKKGGSPKKKKKFPDLSGDGKVTMKDILMARGVIKKKTKKKGKKKWTLRKQK